MMTAIRAGSLAIAIVSAIPTLVQASTAPPGMRPGAGLPPRNGPMFAGALFSPPMFAGMSEAGRRAVMQAMRPGSAADAADHERVRIARDQMLAILSASRLDSVALRRAMDTERELSNAMRTRRQAAMLQAIQSLSPADRRAFAEGARAMRGRFEAMKQRPGGPHGRGGLDDGPASPQPR